MRIQMLIPVLAAMGLAGCTVNNPAPSPAGFVAVPTPAATVITTQPLAPSAVILR